MKISRNIKRIIGSGILVITIISLLTSIAIGMLNRNTEKIDEYKANTSAFYAIVEFTLYEGEGCACDELQDILIFADGQDNDHDVGAYTNDRGYCYLELEIDSTYRISIQDENYQNVLFDILIVDDQEFTFHLTKNDGSVPKDLTVSRTIIEETELISK